MFHRWEKWMNTVNQLKLTASNFRVVVIGAQKGHNSHILYWWTCITGIFEPVWQSYLLLYQYTDHVIRTCSIQKINIFFTCNAVIHSFISCLFPLSSNLSNWSGTWKVKCGKRQNMLELQTCFSIQHQWAEDPTVVPIRSFNISELRTPL